MSYTEIKERLLQETARIVMKDNVVRFRPDLTPCPGDTFALRELAEVPVEAVIVERDPSDVRRLRVVLADDYPQIGSHDVELRLGEPGRVANIRCDLDAWLDVSRFDVATRTGMLPSESLEEIRRKRDALASDEVRASFHEEEVDGDPEYRRWKDETLRGVLVSLDEPSLEEPSLKDSQPRVRPWWTRQLSAVAAVAVLAVGAFWSVRQTGELRGRIATQDEEIVRLDQARSELTEKLEASEEGRAEISDALAERERRMAELERRADVLAPQAMEPNLPFAFLSYGTSQRGEYTILVPEGAGRVALVFEVVNPEPYSHYGLRITEQRSGEEVYSHVGLERDGSLVSLGLPASLLPSGDYFVVLSGHGLGEPTALDESYLLHVRRPGEM